MFTSTFVEFMDDDESQERLEGEGGYDEAEGAVVRGQGRATDHAPSDADASSTVVYESRMGAIKPARWEELVGSGRCSSRET